MKIALVAGGYIPEPPLSNSILTLMEEYKFFLEQIGYQIDIFNNEDVNVTIDIINNGNYNFVHLHSHQFVNEFNQNLKQKYCYTCHNGYFLKEYKWDKNFKEGFKHYLNTPGIIALSHATKDIFLNAGYSGYISVQVNGIDTQKIDFKEQGNNKAICLGWIQARKQQKLLAEIIDGKIAIDFVGPLDDPDFEEGTTTKYLGVWSLKQVYSDLTNYSCLVLISDGEIAPLVVLEAMAAGLCVVISESASANLSCKDFIKVLPDDILINATVENQKIVCDAIMDLIEQNKYSRKEIVRYAKENFDFAYIVKNYIQIIDEFNN
jgi:glycosyltransferase involved in cell wall biosynthesis